MDTQLFRGGLPYAADVNRLRDAFPVPELTEGRIIRHENLEAVVRVKRGGQRYYGIINSWIAQMKTNNGIFIVWEPSIGIKILAPSEILTFAEARTRQKITQTGKAIKNFTWVDRDRLDAVGQQRFDHQMHVASVMRNALADAKKGLAIPLAPIKSLPKPKLVREA